MPILTQTYSANTAIALDLSSLATSTSLLGGRESAQIDNSATQYLDAIVNVGGILGHASSAPVVGQFIGIYVWGSNVSLAGAPIDALDGTESVENLTHGGVLNSLKLAASPTVTAANANQLYHAQPFGVAQFFGGVLPKFWGLFVSHNHTGNLAAANNSLFSFNGITYTST